MRGVCNFMFAYDEICLVVKRVTFPLSEGVTSAYSSTSSMLMFSQSVMMLEILHTFVGLVKSNIITVFLQVRSITICGALSANL